MARMKAIQVAKPGGDFELVEREIPERGENEVLIKVEACGVCRGDAIVKDGAFPLEQAARAYEKMISAKVHFRAMLKP